jgi:transcriptional regulator with XRE-family HTH domain
VEVARELIGEILQQTGCTQEGLEDRYGFPRSTISNLITGKRPMSEQKLKLLLNSYVRDKGVSIELKLVTAAIPKRAGLKKLMIMEKQLYERDAELRRRNFELEERKLRMEFDQKLRDLERLVQE